MPAGPTADDNLRRPGQENKQPTTAPAATDCKEPEDSGTRLHEHHRARSQHGARLTDAQHAACDRVIIRHVVLSEAVLHDVLVSPPEGF